MRIPLCGVALFPPYPTINLNIPLSTSAIQNLRHSKSPVNMPAAFLRYPPIFYNFTSFLCLTLADSGRNWLKPSSITEHLYTEKRLHPNM